ncbi:MAG: hypothetical protein QME94_03915 [Anaerolineae bacterium]|nr:hypothetical protein [Anaerolineae bacterium]
MANPHRTAGCRWPRGLANQITLVAALAHALLGSTGLVGALFLGHRVHVPKAWTYDVVLRALALAFAVVLLLIPALRKRYPRLLASAALGAFASLLLRLATLVPWASLAWITVSYYLLVTSAAVVGALGLLGGERLDELLLGLTAQLLRALLGVTPEGLTRR